MKKPMNPCSTNLLSRKSLRKSPSSVITAGRRLPLEANFCPGCGTRLGQNRTLTNTRCRPPPREKRSIPADTVTCLNDGRYLHPGRKNPMMMISRMKSRSQPSPR